MCHQMWLASCEACLQPISHTECGLCAGEIIKPKGAFQMGLFWLMPVIQPLLCMLLAALAAFSVAYAGVAALHFQPYVAPLLVRTSFFHTPLQCPPAGVGRYECRNLPD